MPNPISDIFLLLFGINLFAIFLLVRRNKRPVYRTFIAGATISLFVVFGYSLTRGNPIVYAIIVASCLAVVFTILSAAFGLYFSRVETNRIINLINGMCKVDYQRFGDQ